MVTEEELTSFTDLAFKIADQVGGAFHGELFQRNAEGVVLRTLHIDVHDAALCQDNTVEPVEVTLQ